MNRFACGLLAAAAISIAGCATNLPPSSVIADITAVASPRPCTNPVAVDDAIGAVNARIDRLGAAVRQRLVTDLQDTDGAAPRFFDSVLALLRTAANRSKAPPSPRTAVNALTIDNIRAFAAALHKTALAPQRPSADAHFAQDMRQFDAILVNYVEAYIQGNYVDRLGNRLPAPRFSSTVGDTEIAGILSVLMDAVGDFFLRTPIWVDNTEHPTQYYPPYASNGANGGHGAEQTPPTADSIVVINATHADHFFPRVALVNQPLGFGESCGVDALKARAIAYLGQTAALRASTAGGLLAADVGGAGFSFVFFQKISVGDSQTIRVMVETLLSKLAERTAAEATYRILVNVNDADLGQLADLLTYAGSHTLPPPPAEPAAPAW